MKNRRTNKAGGFFKKFFLTNESVGLYDVLVSSVEEALELKKKYLATNTQYYILEDSPVLVELQ